MPWPPLALALVCATSCVFLLWPYYANDLQQLPLSNPLDQWPHPSESWPRNGSGPLTDLYGIGVPFAVLVAPLGAIAAAVWAGAWACLEWEHLGSRDRALLVAAAVVAVAFLAFRVSPLGNAVAIWWVG